MCLEFYISLGATSVCLFLQLFNLGRRVAFIASRWQNRDLRLRRSLSLGRNSGVSKLWFKVKKRVWKTLSTIVDRAGKNTSSRVALFGLKRRPPKIRNNSIYHFQNSTPFFEPHSTMKIREAKQSFFKSRIYLQKSLFFSWKSIFFVILINYALIKNISGISCKQDWSEWSLSECERIKSELIVSPDWPSDLLANGVKRKIVVHENSNLSRKYFWISQIKKKNYLN